MSCRADNLSEYPDQPVERPVMFQVWQRITFLHWPYPPEVIRGLLPRNLHLDTFDRAAWIGLTPFVLAGLRAPGIPPLPWISQFPETNVRTYVRGPDGRRGIWFFSLEAGRLAAVIGARLTYGLPYRWAEMTVHQRSDRIEYSSRRRFGRGHAKITIRPGPRISTNELERFLTGRFRLYTTLAGRLALAHVDHPPWPLQSGAVLRLEQDLVENSGVPAVSGEPLVHFSAGVSVRVGRPRFVR